MTAPADRSRAGARLASLSRQLHPPSHFAAKSDDDVVILAVARTPIAKAKRGAFRETSPDVLLAHVLRAALERSGVRAEDVGDIRVGNVLPPNGAVFARMAQFEAGLPYDVPLATVNRQCSSGLQAVADVAAGIRAGTFDVGIAAGVESMSMTGMGEAVPPFSADAVSSCALATDCLTPMGITSETVAAKYGVSRAEQDAFAATSHARAHAAQQAGRFDAEIAPIRLPDGTLVSADEGVRPGTTAQGLAKLRCARVRTRLRGCGICARERARAGEACARRVVGARCAEPRPAPGAPCARGTGPSSRRTAARPLATRAR